MVTNMLSTDLLMCAIRAVSPCLCAMRRKEEQTVGMKGFVAVGVNTMGIEAQIAIPVAVVIALVVVSLGDGRRGPQRYKVATVLAVSTSACCVSLRAALETLKERDSG